MTLNEWLFTPYLYMLFSPHNEGGRLTRIHFPSISFWEKQIILKQKSQLPYKIFQLWYNIPIFTQYATCLCQARLYFFLFIAKWTHGMNQWIIRLISVLFFPVFLNNFLVKTGKIKIYVTFLVQRDQYYLLFCCSAHFQF